MLAVEGTEAAVRAVLDRRGVDRGGERPDAVVIPVPSPSHGDRRELGWEDDALRVSHAFHSVLMEPMLDEVRCRRAEPGI